MTLLAPLLALLSGAQPAAAGQETAAAPTQPARTDLALNGKELMARADAELARIRRGLEEVLSRVEDARVEKDLVKLLCADERLARIKALVTAAENAEVSLAEAIATRDESVMIEYSKIAIARGKVDALRTEAAACIGQLAYDVDGKTTVYVEEPDYLPRVGEPERGRDAGGGDPYRNAFGIPSAALAR
ncbi:MAG TPA: hypothetical protein VLT47_02740 [Anaeromyxobacteraceae bacterium]|nr:hypothetical protein [Anaeromyxobacteraceae bacterium]